MDRQNKVDEVNAAAQGGFSNLEWSRARKLHSEKMKGKAHE